MKKIQLSGRQKKKFRRIINKFIETDTDLGSMQLPTDFAKELNKQTHKASVRKIKNSDSYIQTRNEEAFIEWVKKREKGKKKILEQLSFSSPQ